MSNDLNLLNIGKGFLASPFQVSAGDLNLVEGQIAQLDNQCFRWFEAFEQWTVCIRAELAPQVFKNDTLLHIGNLNQEKAKELTALDNITDLIFLITGLTFRCPRYHAIASLSCRKLYLFASCNVVESWCLVYVRASEDHIVYNRKYYLSRSAFKSYLAGRVSCFDEGNLFGLFKSKVLGCPMSGYYLIYINLNIVQVFNDQIEHIYAVCLQLVSKRCKQHKLILGEDHLQGLCYLVIGVC